MKKYLHIILLALIVAFVISGCMGGSKVLSSLGSYSEICFYTHGEIQDYTDYGKYVFDYASPKGNAYFRKMDGQSLAEVNAYLDHYESWIQTFSENDPQDELVVHYDFDRSIVNESNYFYIEDRSQGLEFASYDLWILDEQNNTVYFFHNNI